MADRPYIFFELTNSLCSTCLRKVEAKVIFQEGRVYLVKHCPDHNHKNMLISTYVDYYQFSRRALKPGTMPHTFNSESEEPPMGEIRWLDDPKPEPRCWECGAINDAGSSECWLCQRRDWNRYPRLGTRLTPPPDLPRRGPLSTIGGLMIGIAALALAIAIFREAPGLGVLLLISVAPALAITELKARKRYRLGAPMSIGERIFRVVGLTIVIPILVAVALAIALFTFCVFFVR